MFAIRLLLPSAFLPPQHACKLVVFDTSPQPWRKAIFPATNALCWLKIVLRIQTLAVHVARATCLTQSRRHCFVRLKYSKRATIPNPATGKRIATEIGREASLGVVSLPQ